MLNFKQLQLLSRTGYLIGLILLGLAGLHACSTQAGHAAEYNARNPTDWCVPRVPA